MTAQPDVREKERELIVRCVAEAYETLDLIPGVNPTDLPWSDWPNSSGSFVGRHRRLARPRPTTHRTAPRR